MGAISMRYGEFVSRAKHLPCAAAQPARTRLAKGRVYEIKDLRDICFARETFPGQRRADRAAALRNIDRAAAGWGLRPSRRKGA